ncbi:MAG: beta strand repeat-containing protein [Lysobacterales bacterium]
MSRISSKQAFVPQISGRQCLNVFLGLVMLTLAGSLQAGVTPLEQHFGPNPAPAQGCSHCQAETTDIYIEVTPGLAQLDVDVFDAEAVAGGTEFDTNSGNVAFEIFDPSGAKFSGFTCDTAGACTCDVGFSCGSLASPDNAWVNFVSVATPTVGHWRVTADVAGGGVNGYRVRAHDGDPSAAGDEVNVYFENAFTPGNANADANPKVDTYFPYVLGGCSFRQNDFDFDSNNGSAGAQSMVMSSRTGAFTQTTVNANLSPNGLWQSNDIVNFTSDSNADEYGVWSLTTTINGLTDNNRTDNFIGRFDSLDPTGQVTIAGGLQNVPLTFRVYAPDDSNAAPVKPFLSQRILSTNIPVVDNVTRHRLEVSFTNPTENPVTFDAANLDPAEGNDSAAVANVITATVPVDARIAFVAGSASASVGGVTEPAGAAGDLIWDPGLVAAGATVVLTYDIDIAPTAAGNIVVTGDPVSDTGTDAEFLDETGTQDLYFGALCELALAPIVGTGAIGDTIFGDVNRNGAVDLGEGLSGVTVTLTGTDGGGNPVQITTMTDGSGNYSFDNLPDGNYVVIVDESTLPATFQGGNTIDPNGGNDSTTSVTLAVGETNNDQDFGYQPATVSGQIYADTNGNGMQDVGEPNLPGVDVVVTDSGGMTQTVTTDANGVWTANVPAGSTTADIVDGTLPPGVTQTEGTDPTTVTAVAATDTDGGIDGFFTPATVSGHVYLDSNGNGTQDVGEPNLPNVDVVITGSDGMMQTVTTDANGDWSASVPPGPTSADVNEATLPAGVTQTEGTDPTLVAAVAGADTDAGNDGYQPPPGTVNGVIYEDTNGNGVQDPGEPGIAGVEVVITDSAGGTQTVNTDASGSYSAPVPAGDTTLDITEATLPANFTRTEGTDPTVVTVPTGGSASDVDGFQPDPGTVSGVIYEDTNGNGVQDPGEPGIPGVEVIITDSTGGTQTVTTDGTGGYSANVPPGSTTLDINDSTLPPGSTQTDGTNVTTVTVPPGGTATDIDGFAPPNGTVTGVIYQDTNGNGMQDPGEPGIPDVEVVITDSVGGTQTVTTDGSGGYAASVPPGDTTVDITEGTLPPNLTRTEGTDPTTVTVPSGGTASDVDGFEPPDGTVTGVIYQDTNGNGVQDPGEPGIPGVQVIITDSGGGTQTVTTDPNGGYSASVPPGSTTVDIVDSTLPPNVTRTEGTDPTTVTVPPGGTASDIDGFEPPDGTVTGVIYEDTNGNGMQDPGEPGIPGVEVLITDSTGGTQIVTTDPTGGYSASVPPGMTVVDIDENTLPPNLTRNEGVDPTTLTVPPGGTVSDIDGFEPPPGNLTGVVYEDTNGNGTQDPGEPGIPGVQVVVTDSGGSTQTLTTGPDGSYATPVPPGDTQVDIDETTLPPNLTQTEGSDPTTVTVPAGGTASDVDGFQPPVSTVNGVIYEDTNGNGTQDPGEPGIGGVDVVVTDSAGGRQTLTTDGTGAYSTSVPAGDTLIDIDDGTLPPNLTRTEGTDPTTVAVPLGGSASDVDGFQPPASSVNGVIYEDTNGNGTQDPGEPGIAGVSVQVTDSVGNVQTLITDASGSYSSPVPAGDTVIDIIDSTLPANFTRTEGTDPTTVTVPVGGSASDVDGFQPPDSSVSGVVYEDTNLNGTQDPGEPGIADVTITIRDSGGSTITLITDASGAYSSPVPAGDTIIDIVEATLPSGLTRTEGTDPTTVTVPVGGTASDIDGFGPNASTVAGVVYLDTNGNGTQDPGEQGIAGVQVVITDSVGGVQTLTTDASGSYTTPVPAGDTVIDIVEATLPAGVSRTEGTDPTTVTVPSGGSASDVDGFQPAVGDNPPVARDEFRTTPLDTPVTLPLLDGNVTDPDDDEDLATVDLDPSTPGIQTSLTTPDGTWVSDGAGSVTFTPVPGFTGTTSIPYEVSDANGNLSNTATLTVVIVGITPTAVPATSTWALILLVLLMVLVATQMPSLRSGRR